MAKWKVSPHDTISIGDKESGAKKVYGPNADIPLTDEQAKAILLGSNPGCIVCVEGKPPEFAQPPAPTGRERVVPRKAKAKDETKPPAK